ncbi:DUF2300 domain-containing protein [Leeia sp. TBRC 13508]|uniref:DUF2300 domain-containing protein n=1 Tax=Leeia speluncae TaxID=2884804 RepID=A0ABS8D852_9NEIS|nr:DUF2300 domain-containing protein [Leeia speluncae]MCB6184356.1 DUF2300 domain-containing protein [Leeia speluncae]
MALSYAEPVGVFARLNHDEFSILAWDDFKKAPIPHVKENVVTPLGSTWKLFVYAYLLDKQIPSEDYDCKGQIKDEVYCCGKGQSIDRENALIKSCGLYFLPNRLGISAKAWQQYWFRLGAPEWIWRIENLTENYRVPVKQLMQALDSLPSSSKRTIASNLMSVATTGTAPSMLQNFGSQLRLKTWTMPNPLDAKQRVGGGLGWLADGSVVWLSAKGTSNDALDKLSTVVQPLLINQKIPDDRDCVLVDYFSDYPIRKVLSLPMKVPVNRAALNGDLLIQFQNGNSLTFRGNGALRLNTKPSLQITGRMGVNEYVARVLDREANPNDVEAAKAFAVIVRSYLIQNAEKRQGCYWIKDSSRYQRVSVNNASTAALKLANWTDELILVGEPVRFHQRLDSPGILSWQTAKTLAKTTSFKTILSKTWPKAQLQSYRSTVDSKCESIPNAEHWLSMQIPKWRRYLMSEVGYEPPRHLPQICKSLVGNPNSESGEGRIYMKSFFSEEDRITLTHEYLHIAFANHPRGIDEVFIESKARQLQRLNLNEN